MKGQFENVLSKGGIDGLKEYSNSIYQSELNVCRISWKVALYRDIGNNEWFINWLGR